MLPKFRRFLARPRTQTKNESDVISEETRSNSNQETGLLFEAGRIRSRIDSTKIGQTDNVVNQDLHFIVDYLGYCQVSEVQSISLLLDSVKRVKKGCSEATRVDFTIKEGVLKISSVGCHSLILTVPLYIVALCAQESLRSFDKCFGVNITRKNAHLCYVFQAGSSLEASSIVRSVALSFKSLGQMLREKKEKMRHSRRRMKASLYHQSSVGSDWSSQSGYYNDSCGDPWQQMETMSRVSSTTSKGSEHPRHGNITRHSYNTPAGKRPSHHSSKHVEFTPLSPVPSNNSSVEKSVENSGFTTEKRRKNIFSEKTKGEFQIEVDVHHGVKLGSVDRHDDAILQETFDETREDSCLTIMDETVSSVNAKDIVDERLESVLSAIRRGDLHHLETYLDNGVDIDLADSTRRSLLFHAVNYSKIGAVQLLLDRGAAVNWEGPNDMSPLHQAAANRDKTIAQVLLANGANVRAKDCDFRTPLHMCAGHPSGTELSCILVEHGARICDNSIDGTRPLDLLPDLKELQSRLVQSVCEAFMAADASKSRSNSGASSQSYQLNQSMLSGGGAVHGLGSLRNLYNQSPLLRHAKQASRHFTANFDLRSFQWKKEAKCVMEDNPAECAISKHERLSGVSGDHGGDVGTGHDIPVCTSCPTPHDITSAATTTTKQTRKLSSEDESQTSSTAAACKSSLGTSHEHGLAPRPPLGGLCGDLGENIVAEHQSGTTIVGSLNTWTKGTGSHVLLSSTPVNATTGLGIVQNLVHDDVIQDGPNTTAATHSKEPGARVKEDRGNATARTQSILHHHGKSFPHHARAKHHHRAECVRFQNSPISPSKEPDHSVDCSHGNITTDSADGAKENADRSRERTRSNADSCYSSMSPCSREEDPVLMALGSLVKLSFNPECQPLLLSYLCLPKASSQLSVIAQSPLCGQWVADAVAILIKNLASIEGPDSRRRAAEAGFIRTVLELADVHEPVQTTCLEVLDNVIKDVKCEHDYTSTMTNIPSGPLLNLLHHHSTVDIPSYPNTSGTADDTTASACNATTFQLRDSHLSGGAGKDANNKSFNVMVCSEDSRSTCGSCRHCCHGNLSPRLVATRLLAASSAHLKMQRELGASRAVCLLLEALDDSNEEVMYNAVVTLANIAMFYDSHCVLHEAAAVDKLRERVSKESKAYYHMSRALVYLNEDDEHLDYLFDIQSEEPDALYTEDSANDTPHIKGAGLETLVRGLTNDIMSLWGGVPLLTSSPQQTTRSRGTRREKRKATENHVIEFFLATYSTYTNAVVLMRLFIHRFHDPKLSILFDEETGIFLQERHSLPPLHVSLMRIWVTWLEVFPGDFKNSVLQSEVSHLISMLASYRGPYLVCAERLDELFTHYKDDMSIPLPPKNHCHHDVLFRSCQQAVVSAALPARLDDAIYLAALQLYIEMSSLGKQSSSHKVFQTETASEKISISRIKFCLNPAFHKVKNVYKRVRTYYGQIYSEAPSERKAKHDYVDCCQGMVGYGCKFYRVKESTCSHKSYLSKRLVGINPKEVVLLEAKTKNLVRKWDLNSLLGWKCEENNTALVLLFSESSTHLVCDSNECLERIQETVKQCVYERNCEDINENDFLPWSERSEEKGNWGKEAMYEEVNQRLRNISKSTRIFGDQEEWKSLNLSYSIPEERDARIRRHSSPSPSSSNRSRRHGVSPPSERTASGHSNEDVAEMAYSVGTLERREFGGTRFARCRTDSPHNKSSSTWQSSVGQQSYLDSSTSAAYHSPTETSRDHAAEPIRCDDGDVMIATRLRICLCAPDAELAGFNRANFTPLELLRYPRELARQITLIDHELFRRITNSDILKRVSEGTAKRRKKGDDSGEITTVKMFSDRFNQLSSWVVSSLLKEESHDATAEMVVQYIETAKQCLELRNYNAMMAIGVGALCSAPVRRLRKARELIPKWYLDQLHIMEVLMDSRENHKKYRESLKVCPSPAVPYFGVFLKDLIYISEGNSDYLNGGLVNLSKRRLLYAVLHQVRRFQVKTYNFEQVPEIKDFLLNTQRYTEEELHRMSRKLDPSSRRTISEGSHGASMSMSAVSLA